ncbi:MAG: malate synthase G [Steroidobacteraceae bacterium]
MNTPVERGRLKVDAQLEKFVREEALPGTGIEPGAFWQGMEATLAMFMPRNSALLAKRDHLQAEIDAWWHAQRGKPFNVEEATAHLRKIGYLVAEPGDFSISTSNVDPEIATIAGPQLVVPVSNARYALNAANARWGSLYDALYGTDALAPVDHATKGYNAERGAKVVAHARQLLDQVAPLAKGSHADATGYTIDGGALRIGMKDGGAAALADATLFAGWRGQVEQPEAILLKHNGLHIEIRIDRAHPIGSTDPAGIADLVLESALTTIQDCEDSVAAVDAEDKVHVYRNWLGLMKGDLKASVAKGAGQIVRTLNPDRVYRSPTGGELTLKGRSLMLVRNVGHHMMSDAILFEGQPIYETVMDALVTVAIALHDIKGPRRNSSTGSIYIVKPKMHGPAEVALANELFAKIEQLFGLQSGTVKMGVMDEERRTSANLKACIKAAATRIAFINTGFLDRTGDEIHTAMEGGPFLRKDDIRTQPWIAAYERRNVEIGLLTGFSGKAQIGKGMWAMPDLMGAMMTAKIGHPKAGANTAWVPSPTAATLHAMHYHQVNVASVQATLLEGLGAKAATGTAELLTPPLGRATWSATEIQAELDNNIQGILGYVVRWVDQGVGCSKVPDIHDVGLMEDRATLRISSQHVANWLHHGVCSDTQVRATFERMAKIVDKQNAGDALYRPMAADLAGSIAYQAACELVFAGRVQPNGYTEHILHRRRRELKASSTWPSNQPS